MTPQPVTNAQAQAAADEWARHAPRRFETDGDRWWWVCDFGCSSGRDELDATDERTVATEIEQHEFRAAVQAAMALMPEVIDSDPQWWCRTCGNRYGDATGLLIVDCSCGERLEAVTVQLVCRDAAEATP